MQQIIKKNLLILFCVCLHSMICHADGLLVSSFSADMKDLSVRTKPRIGNNGKDCALVKVLYPSNRLSFEGNIIGNISYIDSEYWVYMEEGSDVLIVNNVNCDPLTILFNEYDGIGQLESKVTYKLILQLDKYDYNKTYTFKTSGEHNGHSYVDLGLSVKWATCNIGANIPSEQGLRFAWGETNSKSSFTSDNYKFRNIGLDDLDRDDDYILNGFSGIFKTESNNDYDLELDHLGDAASVRWGGNWRMPNGDEIIELYCSCTFIWTSFNGVEGAIVTGPNGNSIFLPLVDVGKDIITEGMCPSIGWELTDYDSEERKLIKTTKIVEYWSSSESWVNRSHNNGWFHYPIVTLELGDGYEDVGYGIKYEGYPIRPVLGK